MPRPVLQVIASTSLQPMDLTTLRAVLWDLRPKLVPSRFEKAQQPDPATIQLGCRSLKGMVWLELSWQAEAPRLVEVNPPPRSGSGSTFAQQLQHSLRQLALVELHQSGFERVVEFRFAQRPGEPIQRVLVLELMGRHSNLLLLDEERNIIALGRQVRDHQSRVRPLSTGDSYSHPPMLQGLAPDRTEGFERWKERLSLVPIPLRKAFQQTYQGISPALAGQLAGDHLNAPVDSLVASQWNHLFERWSLWLEQLESEQFALVVENDGRYRVWGAPTTEVHPQPALALTLGSLHQQCQEQRALARVNHELRQRLERWRSKEQAAQEDQRQRLNATEGHGALQRQADALLCLGNPSRDQVDEAQSLYRRAKKLRRSRPILEQRLKHHQRRLELINESETFMEDQLSATWQDCPARLSALNDLREELDELLQPKERRGNTRHQRQRNQPKPLELTTPGGLKVQVGRNHRQNDWISLRQARSGDLWFHAQECPGSHVVLKSSNGLAEESDLVMATDLAAYFSRARGNMLVAVVMVPTDQLQRIPGAGPGTVRHGQAEIRWGDPQGAEERLLTPSLSPHSG
ncbi:NFACT family protein [Synechococcus sp. MU1642]|uniref:Rqc2 family fibronectin-binding protein n=1 Tax=Synechococcus sp. MU1642 TaxID=2508348 RepID=UPI001CF8273F|nr:NFACT RNA binding domain-containing protein [Synechococcus sp. MU1642]